jgi:ATP-binding cassette, subfamily B (MDR/TAP), member 1
LYLAVAELVAIFIGTAGFSIVGEHITLRIREKYLEAVLRQDIAFFDKIQSGEIAASVSKDVNLIQDGISEKAALILAGLGAFVASLVISFVKSWKLTFIVLSTTVAFILAIAIGGKLMIGSKTKALESQGKAAGITEEAVASIRVTTAFGAQDFLLDRYMRVLNEAQKWGLQVRFSGGLLIGLSTCVIYMEHALSFWQGSRFLVNNEISLSAVITIQIALMMGGAYLAQLLPQLQALPLAVAAAKKIFSTIERPSLIDALSDEGIRVEKVHGDITFHNVTFSYPTRKEHVFTDLSFIISAKKVTALVGPSGCGKSTVISLLERFYDPSSGRIILDGHDISSLNIRWLRQQMSLVSQEPILFSGTIFDNIESGLGDDEVNLVLEPHYLSCSY